MISDKEIDLKPCCEDTCNAWIIAIVERLKSAEDAISDAIAYEDAVIELDPDVYKHDRFREKSFEKGREHFKRLEERNDA